MFKNYKASELVMEINRLIDAYGDADICINTLNEEQNAWNFARNYLSIGADGEGTFYIDGKYE